MPRYAASRVRAWEPNCEDPGLHEASSAEGRPAQAERSGHVDSRRRFLRSQRAGCVRAGRSAAPERKARRAKSWSSPPVRRARSRFCAKPWPKAPTAPFIWKTTTSSALDAYNTARAIRGRHQRRKLRPDLHRPAIRRLRLRADRRHSGRNCWAGRTPPSSCRSKKMKAASG